MFRQSTMVCSNLHFAELIALECISIIQSQQGNHYQFDDWDYGYDAALDKTENDVRQFFGVGG